jgi:hypothetical protein
MTMGELSFGLGRSAVLALLLSGVFVLACGKTEDDDDDTDCPSLCERARECPGAVEEREEPEPDCATECAEFENAADRVGCSAEVDAYYACVAGVVDVCTDVVDQCSAEVEKLVGCLVGDGTAGCTDGGPTTNATCEGICERTRQCTGEAYDCAAACAVDEAEVVSTGCGVEYQGYLDCLASCDDICLAYDPYDCESSYYSYLDCIDSI